MKITQLYDHFFIKGGVERVLALQLNAWAEKAHEATLLVREGSVSQVYPLSPLVEKVGMGHIPGAGRIRRVLNYILDVPTIRGHRAVREADIVIANGPWCALLAILALKFGRRTSLKPRLIVCDHNSPSAFGRLTRSAGRLLYSRADCVVAFTQAQRGYYAPFVRKVRVIPNPAEAPKAEDPPTLPPNRSVLAVGRLSRQKGFDQLLEAWSIVAGKVPDATLTIVGEGEERESLLLQAKKLGISQVVHLHPVTENISRYYQASSILAVSSRYEGLSLVLLEAQAHGLPIVSFDCEFGPREVVTDGVDGILCPAGDVASLANGLIRLLQRGEARQQMARAALASSEKYALPTVLARWDQLFEDLK